MATLAHQLADSEQEIDRLKAQQAQILLENADLDKHFKEAQELTRSNADLIKDLKSTQSQMIQDNADLAARLKSSQEQVTNLAAQLDASQTQMAKVAAQIKTSQDQIARLMEQKQRVKPLASSSFPTAGQVRKPVTAPSVRQANPQPQSSVRSQPREQ